MNQNPLQKSVLVIGALLMVLAGTVADAAAACRAAAACERHSPYVRVAERVQIAAAGDVVANEVTMRNTDSCACGRQCFTLGPGYHPPHDGSPSVRVDRVRLRTLDNVALNGLCLEPGEEATAALLLALSNHQDGPGYVTPVVQLTRAGARYVTPEQWLVDSHEEEGGALCVGYTPAACRAFVYPASPSR